MNKVRYLSKDVNANERLNYSLWWREQIEQYGTEVTYFTNKTTLEGSGVIYGEQPTAGYENKGTMVIATNITNDSIILSKFGIQADCDMVAIVHIDAFYEKLGKGSEPKSGDLIEMTEYGGVNERPNGRGAPVYEITERDDEYLQNTNTLAGHYVWYIKCRRFEFSYEPGVLPEPVNTQVNDNAEYGKLDSTITEALTAMPYQHNVDDFAKQFLFDYTKTDLDRPYGNY